MTLGQRIALPVLAALALAGVAGCAAPPRLTPGAPGTQTAFFANYPQDLLAAAASACIGPGQTARRPAQGTVICETLPTPESAAALIIVHDGTIDALPSYIIGFQADAAPGGYLVTADSYIRVPQESGGVAQIRLPDEAVAEVLQALLIDAGGTPVGPPAPL